MVRVDWLAVSNKVFVLSKFFFLGWFERLSSILLLFKVNQISHLVWAEVDDTGMLRVKGCAVDNQVLQFVQLFLLVGR